MIVENKKTLVIGTGNKFRRDDGAGPAVAQLLRTKLPNDVAVIEHSGEGASLMEAWRKTSKVILIDAVQSGAVPGTIHRIDAVTGPLPESLFPCSTHGFGVAEAIELARGLHELPPSVIIYGIEAGNLGDGEGLSSEVQGAVATVADQIIQETASCDNQTVASAL